MATSAIPWTGVESGGGYGVGSKEGAGSLRMRRPCSSVAGTIKKGRQRERPERRQKNGRSRGTRAAVVQHARPKKLMRFTRLNGRQNGRGRAARASWGAERARCAPDGERAVIGPWLNFPESAPGPSSLMRPQSSCAAPCGRPRQKELRIWTTVAMFGRRTRPG